MHPIPPLDASTRILKLLVALKQGYENLGFDQRTVPPPLRLTRTKCGHLSMTSSQRLWSPLAEYRLSVEDAREALIEELQSECCSRTKAARDALVSSMENESSVHYELQTFTGHCQKPTCEKLHN